MRNGCKSGGAVIDQFHQDEGVRVLDFIWRRYGDGFGPMIPFTVGKSMGSTIEPHSTPASFVLNNKGLENPHFSLASTIGEGCFSHHISSFNQRP
jgi:hypothetical protein